MIYAPAVQAKNTKNAAVLQSKNDLIYKTKESIYEPHRKRSTEYTEEQFLCVLCVNRSSWCNYLRIEVFVFVYLVTLLMFFVKLKIIGVDTVVVRRFASTDCCF